MAQGQEYLTSNAAIAYPFRDDATGLARDTAIVHYDEYYPATSTIPIDLFVDMLIVIPNTVERVYLKDMYLSDGSDIWMTLADELGNTLIYGYCGNIFPGETRYYLPMMLDDPASGIFVKMMFKTSVLLEYIGSIGFEQFAQTLPISDRVINRLCNRIESFDLYNDGVFTAGPIQGDVKLVSGYNMLQTITADSVNTTTITLAALRGAGEGKAPCPDPEQTSTIKRQLMQLTPDADGNIQIQMGDDNCYALVPTVTEGEFMIQGTCLACCQCDDYANVAAAIRKLLEQASQAYKYLNDARDNDPYGYEAGVTEFNRSIMSTRGVPKLKVTGIGGSAWAADPSSPSNLAGSPAWVTFVVTFKNNSNAPVEVQTFNLGLTAPPPYSITHFTHTYESSSVNYSIPVTFAVPIIGTPSIGVGKNFSIYILARADDYTLDPTWAGVATIHTDSGDFSSEAYAIT